MEKASNNTELDFNARVEAAIAASTANMKTNRLKSDIAIDYELKKISLAAVNTILHEIYDIVNFDTDRLDFIINKSSRKSEYGRLTELLSHVAKVYAWPVESVSEAKEIDSIQEEILDYFRSKGMDISHDLLMDIKESKGHHSFLDTTTYEIIDATEPDYEEFGLVIKTFAEYVGLPIIDYKLTEQSWHSNEIKAQRKIQVEHEAAQAQLAKEKALASA